MLKTCNILSNSIILLEGILNVSNIIYNVVKTSEWGGYSDVSWLNLHSQPTVNLEPPDSMTLSVLSSGTLFSKSTQENNHFLSTEEKTVRIWFWSTLIFESASSPLASHGLFYIVLITETVQ